MSGRQLVGALVSAAALLAATAAAALVAARLYIGGQMALVLVGAAAGSVLLTLLLRWLRSPGAVVALGSLAGLGAVLVGLVAALRHRGRTDGTLTVVLLDAITNSGARLMTSPIPIEPAPDTVLLPLVVTWLAGTAAALLLGRWPLAALAPPVVLLVGALVFVGPNAGPAYHLVALLALAAAAHLVLTRDGGATAAAVSA
ncbi:MAG: transglutaminase domain-containing protein, partial [Micromonosporaceae bacterium]